MALIGLIGTSLAGRAPQGSRKSQASPETVRQLIAKLGPRGAFERLVNNPDQSAFYDLLGGVASAKREWLDLVTQLAPVSQGYGEEMLAAALSEALERDPIAILERRGSGIRLDRVCGYDPFQAVNSVRTRKQFLQALQPRERAVAAVNRSDLARAKNECIAAIARLKADSTLEYR
jgi:hypothetical protein